MSLALSRDGPNRECPRNQGNTSRSKINTEKRPERRSSFHHVTAVTRADGSTPGRQLLVPKWKELGLCNAAPPTPAGSQALSLLQANNMEGLSDLGVPAFLQAHFPPASEDSPPPLEDLERSFASRVGAQSVCSLHRLSWPSYTGQISRPSNSVQITHLPGCGGGVYALSRTPPPLLATGAPLPVGAPALVGSSGGTTLRSKAVPPALCGCELEWAAAPPPAAGLGLGFRALLAAAAAFMAAGDRPKPDLRGAALAPPGSLAGLASSGACPLGGAGTAAAAASAATAPPGSSAWGVRCWPAAGAELAAPLGLLSGGGLGPAPCAAGC